LLKEELPGQLEPSSSCHPLHTLSAWSLISRPSLLFSRAQHHLAALSHPKAALSLRTRPLPACLPAVPCIIKPEPPYPPRSVSTRPEPSWCSLCQLALGARRHRDTPSALTPPPSAARKPPSTGSPGSPVPWGAGAAPQFIPPCSEPLRHLVLIINGSGRDKRALREGSGMQDGGGGGRWGARGDAGLG